MRARRVWSGGRGRFELAGFYNDVTNEQLFVLDFLSFQFLPVNLDTSTYGIEVQGDVLLARGLRLGSAVAWTQGEIQEASAISGAVPGNRIPNVAEWSGALSLDYEGDRIEWSDVAFAPIASLSFSTSECERQMWAIRSKCRATLMSMFG